MYKCIYLCARHCCIVFASKMNDLRVAPTAFQCFVCLSGDKQEYDESLMLEQKKAEVAHNLKTQGDFGLL